MIIIALMFLFIKTKLHDTANKQNDMINKKNDKFLIWLYDDGELFQNELKQI